jgi:hypothetical protein
MSHLTALCAQKFEVMLCYVMLCCFMVCYGILCCVILCYAVLCYVMYDRNKS